MRVERLSADPELLLIHDFVSADEARALTQQADGHFDRSTTVCEDPSGCAIPDRTSSSAVVAASPMINAIKTRGMAFARAPAAEEIQVVRYHPGEEFKPHLDAFDASAGGAREVANYGGRQRDATILIYLSGPEEGGETVFPELGLSVAPVPRAALYWRNIYPNGSIDRRMLHGGAPVRRGVKYAANLWLRGDRDRVYELAHSEDVAPPRTVPIGKQTAILTAVGTGIGAAIGGTAGGMIGGTVGWALDAIRRRLISPV